MPSPPTHPADPRARSVRTAPLVGGLLVAAATALAIDLPVQSVLAASYGRGTVRDFYDAAEFFGNGFGVVLVLGTLVVLDRFRRVQLGRLLAASLGAGILANVGKMLVGRNRPYDTEVEALIASGGSGIDTFVCWAPLASLGAGGQSFPSAHTTTAFGLAVALAYACPRGARWFYALAAGVAVQRVAASSHFPSDVLVGAALGVTWGRACCGGVLAGWFDAVEAWWSRRFGWPLPAGHPRAPSPSAPPAFAEPDEAPRRAA